MKTNNSLLIVTAAAVTGAALVKLGNASFLADVSGESLIALVLSAGLIGFFALDYRRPAKTAAVPAEVVRPTLPAKAAAPAGAYGIRRRSAIVERIAG